MSVDQWPTRMMQQNRIRLEELKSLVDGISLDDEDISSEMSRFLVIRSCGYVEKVFEDCLIEFTRENSHSFVASHVISAFGKGSNARPDNLLGRAGKFNNAWKSELNKYFDQNENTRENMLKLVEARNKIAHGDSDDTTKRTAIKLADVALELGDELIRIIDPRMRHGE